jgi:hypothetical protein
MSRVILSKYDDGSNHVVVGWDHPAGGAFWTEYATKAEIAAAERQMHEWEIQGAPVDKADEMLQLETLIESAAKREGGMWPGIKLNELRESMPEELRPLITDQVLDLLSQHSEDPDSGYRTGPIDWTQHGS